VREGYDVDLHKWQTIGDSLATSDADPFATICPNEPGERLGPAAVAGLVHENGRDQCQSQR
jgi:hypothetical protein